MTKPTIAKRLRLPLVVMVAILSMLVALPTAFAAPGGLLDSVNEPLPNGGIGIGIDYDGTDILYTHSNHPDIHKTDLNGNDLGTLPLVPPTLVNAIAFNFNDGFLYAGSRTNTNLYKIDMANGAISLVKANAVPVSFNFVDGLAWDPTDNHFWMSDDVVCNVRHLDALGNDIGGFDGCGVTGLSNSGLAVSLSGQLWYGTNGSGKIFSLTPGLHDGSLNPIPMVNNGQFASPGGRDEDMVCGPRFTKADGSEVETLLSQDAFNNTFAVIEVAEGECVSPAEARVPECNLIGVENGVLKVEVRALAGLADINVLTDDNANVAFAFTAGTTDPVIVTGSKINAGDSSRVELRITDLAGNVVECDPVMAELNRSPSSPRYSTYDAIPQAEKYFTISNTGESVLTYALVNVNGTWFVMPTLLPYEVKTIDIGSALVSGDDNTVTVWGGGHGSQIMISDVMPKRTNMFAYPVDLLY